MATHSVHRAQAMLGFVLFAAGLLPGCTSPPTVPGGPSDEASCPLVYPDGTAFDCRNPLFEGVPVPNKRPDPVDGWRCGSRWVQDEGPAFVELYHHSDGRLGTYWHFPDVPQGQSFVTGELFVADAEGQAWVQPHQVDGFRVWPAPPGSTESEIHVRALSFVVDIELDGNWTPAEDLDVIAGRFQSHPYYALSFDGPNGRDVLDVMVPVEAAGTFQKFDAAHQDVRRDGYRVFATAWQRGVYFADYDGLPTANRAMSCVATVTGGL